MREYVGSGLVGELERLLVERVVLCWLALHSTKSLRADKWGSSISHESADFWDRHVSKLNSDFLKACKTLALVQRLRLPAMQVNIADKQVNISGE